MLLHDAALSICFLRVFLSRCGASASYELLRGSALCGGSGEVVVKPKCQQGKGPRQKAQDVDD